MVPHCTAVCKFHTIDSFEYFAHEGGNGHFLATWMTWEFRMGRRIHLFDGHVALILWYLTVLQFANFAARRNVDILPLEVAKVIVLPPD